MKKNNPLITVIVPIYNVEKYLRHCVDSILSQSYHNLEVWLVDDGSPDGCPTICDEYARKDNRIKVIHKKNGGLSDARNVAIDVASGEYICFVDSDDYVAPTYVETLYSLIEKYHTKASIINPVAIDEDGNLTHSFQHDNQEYCWSADETLEQMFYQNKFDTTAWGKLYHRSLFESGIRYPKGLLFEDLPTTYLLFKRCDKIAFKATELYYYLLRSDSIEGSVFSNEKMDSAMKIFDSFKAHEDLLTGCKDAYYCRMLSFAFHILLSMPEGYPRKKELYSKVREYRTKVLFNAKARKKTRVAALLSYFGLGMIRRCFKLIRHR